MYSNNNKPSPFLLHGYDLGTDDKDYGMTKEDVDDMLKNSSVSVPCYICGNESFAKLVAKNESDNTSELERIGYVCINCLERKLVDSKLYGIRKLNNNDTRGGILGWL